MRGPSVSHFRGRWPRGVLFVHFLLGFRFFFPFTPQSFSLAPPLVGLVFLHLGGRGPRSPSSSVSLVAYAAGAVAIGVGASALSVIALVPCASVGPWGRLFRGPGA